jgi:hypothetical protein
MTQHICRFIGHHWGYVLTAGGRAWFRCPRCHAVRADVGPAA